MNHYNSHHHRRSIRLKGYDYSSEGLYFITICCHHHVCLFGDIIESEMILNKYGRIAQNEWLKTIEIRPEVELGEFIIMPNHMHAIVRISGRGVSHTPHDIIKTHTPHDIIDIQPSSHNTINSHLSRDTHPSRDINNIPIAHEFNNINIPDTHKFHSEMGMFDMPHTSDLYNSDRGVCDIFHVPDLFNSDRGVCGIFHASDLYNSDRGVCDIFHAPDLCNSDRGVCDIFHAPDLCNSDRGVCGIFHAPDLCNSDRGVCDTPLREKTPFRSPSKTIGAIVRGYKSAVTKQLNVMNIGCVVWQRNYYEIIIRNEQSYNRIANYIVDNPAKWNQDKFHNINKSGNILI